MTKSRNLIWLTFMCIMFFSCVSKKNILTNTILKDEFLSKIAHHPDYEVQILYTTFNKKKKTFHSSSFHLDETKYFYPASTVKMPVAILTLQKINELKENGIDINQTDVMLTAALNDELKAAYLDTTTINHKPNIERYIEKIFVISDNDAFNRLYEFLGPDYINESLKSIGVFTQSCINHRLSLPNLSINDNQKSNNIRFFRGNKFIYDKVEYTTEKQWKHHTIDASKGLGYLDNKDSLILHPFDFSTKNFYSIRDMEATLQRLILPTFFSPQQRFNLTTANYEFLLKTMSALPKTYGFSTGYPDNYVKFFIFGDSKSAIPDDIKIFNKVGNAYGYLIDCAYIENKSKDIGFFLTAVIHVNKNQIYNDGVYEYEQIGIPFLARLGKVVYEYELKRHQKK